MTERTMDEMIKHFNDTVCDMNISREYKMKLLGMITAIGYKYKQAADAIEELQRIVNEYQKFDGFLSAHGMYEVGPVIPIEPPKEETE